MCSRPPIGVPRGVCLAYGPCGRCARAHRGTNWVPLALTTTARGAGTLDQQRATIERVSKEIGALADLVEANEAKGRMGQARVGASDNVPHGVLTGYSSLLTWHSRVL